MMKKFISIIALISAFLVLALYTIAQTGPAGIGTSSENVLWLRADQGTSITTDGNPISYWNDISGNANHSTQGTGALQPNYIASGINSLPSIRFSGASNQYLSVLDNDNLDNTNGVSVFVVAQPMSPDALARGLVSKRISSGSEQAYSLFTYTTQNIYFDAAADRINGSDPIDTSAQIFSAIYNGADANPRSRIYYNGNESGNGNGPTSIGNMTSDLYIGTLDAGYAQGFNGDISEVIVYRTALNNAERLILETYLSNRYNISLTASAYSSTTYTQDFIGIGHSGGDKYSDTENVGSGILLSERNGSLDEANEFVFTGHDGTAHGTNTNDLPSIAGGSLEERWDRIYYIERIQGGIVDAGTTDIRIGFDFTGTGITPASDRVYYLLYRSGTSGAFSEVPGGTASVSDGKVWMNVSSANFNSGYYVIAKSDQELKTWYSLNSYNWDNPDTWSLKPNEPNNPSNEIPGIMDMAVIQDNKTVTVTSAASCGVLNVINGTVDFGTVTGNSFSTITGQSNGIIKLAADNFPVGDASGFADEATGGTVIYNGTGYDLSTSRTYRNMIINLTNSTDQVILLSNYTLNGSLTINQGELHFGNGTSVTNREFTVYEDVEVRADGKIRTGDATDTRHEFNLYGNFTNYGDVQFTNRSSANYTAEAADGIVDVNFLSATRDQLATLEGPTRFYRIAIEKGISSTYELFLEATNAAYFELFGYANEGHPDNEQLAVNNNSFGLAYGTVRVGDNITIPRLNGLGNYNVSENAILWVDGGTVTKPSGTAVVVYGKVKVSDGTFNADINSGITIRLNGTFESTGGTTNLRQFRTSVYGAQHQGGYVQSGGTVNLLAGGLATDYYRFTLTYPGNVFNMSGGTLHIQQTGGKGGIFINSDEVNQNVTGGTVICDISDANDFIITSKAPFGSLELRKTVVNTNIFELDEGVDVGGSDEYLAAQPLVVLNDLTIGDGCFLDHNGQDITIGRNFSIAENSQQQTVGGTNNYGLYYNAAEPNTLTFNGDQNGTFYQGYNVDDNYELYVWNLTVNKTGGSQILIQGNTNKEPPNTQEHFNRIINVQGTIDVQDGTLNQGKQSIRLYGPMQVSSTGELGVYEPGVTELTAYIMLKDGDTELSVEEGAELGNFKLNPAGGSVVSLASDIYIKRIGFHVGLMNIKNHKLKVDYLHNNATTNNYTFGVDATKMIYSDANASDGGIELYIPANSSGSTFGIPLGTSEDGVTRSTPAEIRIDSDTDDGYIQIRPVDGELLTTNLTGGNLLSYYWRVGHSGFTAPPTVRLRFRYNAYDDDASDEANFTQGKVLNENPYTRSEPSGWVNTGNNTIGFDPATLENANFTAGESGRFTGNVEIYYSIATNISNCNWNNGNYWTRNDILNPVYENHDSRQPTAGDYPQEGDIAVIGWCPWDNTGLADIDPGDPHLIRLTSNIECAQLIFTPMEDAAGNPRAREPRYASVFRPCLGIYDGRNLTTGLVEGEGMFWCKDSDPDFSLMDLGEFALSDSSYILYENYDASRTYVNVPSELPNLMITSDSWGRNDHTTIITTDIRTNGSFEIIGDANVQLNTGAEGDITIGGNLKIFEVTDPDAGTPSGGGGEIRFQNSGNARTITVSGDILLNNEGNSIYVESPGANNIAHQMIVGGDISQTETGNGLLFSTGIGDDHIDLTLNGDGNNAFNISAGSIPEFHRVIMNKGTDQTSSFTFNGDFNLNGPTDGLTEDKALYLQNGKLILNDTDIDIDLSSGGEDFYIPSSSGLVVQAGKVNVYGADNGILLNGLLRADGANSIIDMDGGAGVDNYIEYSASGNATIEIENDAQLTVGSQIRRGTSSAEGILKYSQTGGNVIVGKNAAPEGNRGTFEVINNGSEFTHTGGTLTIVNPQTSPTAASVILEPSISNVGDATLQLGNDDTPAASTLTLKSKVALGNLTVSGTNGPTAQLLDRSLIVKKDLTIDAGSTFDGTGSFNLTVNRNILNNGTADLNIDTLFLKGTNTSPSAAMQEITGNVTVNHLVVEPETSVTLQAGSNLEVDGDLYLNNGQLVDGENTILVNGNVTNNASHASSNPALGGIKFGGSALQRIYGTGQFGRIEIDNTNGVQLENSLSLINDLTLTNGILQLQSYKLTLGLNSDIVGSGFDNTKMIAVGGGDFLQGIQKTFRTVASATPADPYDDTDAAYTYHFTFPIGIDNGSLKKYTPVDFNVASNATQGSVGLHPVNRKHITLDDTQTDVLQYYWIMNSSGLSNFTSLIKTHYKNADVVGDESVYIGAKLYDNFWAKFEEVDYDPGPPVIDEIEVVYEDDDYVAFISDGADFVTGEYTAGIEPHIPDEVPIFYSKQDGDWNDPNTWEREDGGTVPANGPAGQRVHIRTAHTVTVSSNFRRAYRTTINGRLELGTSYNHILGYVAGNGTLSSESSSLPSGNFDDFFACGTGGTMEWAGAGYGLPSSIKSYNNLTVTGTGTKTMPNEDMTICGDLRIEGDVTLKHQAWTSSGYCYTTIDGDVYLSDNATWDLNTRTWVRLRGDFSKENTATFDAAYSYQTFYIDGTEDQTFTGNFESPEWFNNIYFTNSNNIVFNGPASVKTFFYLYDGRVQTSSSSLFTVTRTGGNGLVNYLDGLFEGPVRINMKDPGTTKKFLPVGKNGIKKFIYPLDIPASLDYWTGEYFNTSPTGHTSMTGDLKTISQSEYWAITGPAGVSSRIELTLDGTSDVAAGVGDINDLRIVYWNGTAWEIAGTDATITGDASTGTISTTASFSFDGTEQFFTIGAVEVVEIITATIASSDASICESETYTLEVTIVGNNPPFELDYSIGGVDYTEININDLDLTIDLSAQFSLGSNTITLNEIRDSDTPINTGSIIGGSVTVTVYADHSTPYPTVTSGGDICGATTTTVELDGSDVGFTYELFRDATYFSSLTGTGGALTFTGIDQAGTYTVVAYNSSLSSCNANMDGFAEIKFGSAVTAEITSLISAATICEGEVVEFEITFTGTPPFTFTVEDNDGGSWADIVVDVGDLSGAGPYTYNFTIPDQFPVWTAPDLPNEFIYSITSISDSGTCGAGTVVGTGVNVDVYKIPETGPQYHISNDFGN